MTSDAPTYFSVDLPGRKTEDGADRSPAEQDFDLFVLEADFDLGWGVLSYNGAVYEQTNVVTNWLGDVFGLGPGTGDGLNTEESVTHELRLASRGTVLSTGSSAYTTTISRHSGSTMPCLTEPQIPRSLSGANRYDELGTVR